MSNRHWSITQKIMQRIRICRQTGCWIWTGPTSGTGRGGGYPRMNLDGQTVAVHRVMFTQVHGYVPGRKQIDHKCRNRLCVNPGSKHWEMATHKKN